MKCLLFSPPLAHLWCNDVTIRAPNFCLCPAMHWSSRHHVMMDQMHPWFFYCLSSLKIRQQLSNNHHISKHHKKYFQENNLYHHPFLCEISTIRHNICSNSIKSLDSCLLSEQTFWAISKDIKQIPFVLCLLHWKDWASPEIMKKSNEWVQ